MEGYMCMSAIEHLTFIYYAKKILHKLRVVGCDNKLNAIIYKSKIASEAIFLFFFFLSLLFFYITQIIKCIVAPHTKEEWLGGYWMNVY